MTLIRNAECGLRIAEFKFEISFEFGIWDLFGPAVVGLEFGAWDFKVNK